MPEIRIIDEVRARLEHDPRIPHSGAIAIIEAGGTITLRGSVGSFRQRRAAVEDAKSIRRVRWVSDELKVDWEDRVDDDELRGAALQMLVWDPAVPDDRIDVKVSDGWLTLKGEVRHQCESDAAFNDVSKLPGVGGITNEITVVTAGLDG